MSSTIHATYFSLAPRGSDIYAHGKAVCYRSDHASAATHHNNGSSFEGGLATLLRRCAMILVALGITSPMWATELRIDYDSQVIWSRWNHFTFAGNADDLIDYGTGLHTTTDVTVSGWTHRTEGPYLWPYDSLEWIPTGVGKGAATRFGSGVSTISFSEISGPWRIEILSTMDPRVSTNFIQDITVNGQFADQDYRHIGANGHQFDAAH